ncbi:MAG: S-layer homology domain-containing protein, partial [Clostridiales bacterium]|nr:S-layer homology domain-containing protein [Clostridiales bacterium]
MSFSLKWTAQATQKMHSSQHCKRSLLISFAVFLVLIALPISGAYADTYTDTEGHWASEAIERWSDLGILKGSGDGLFRPDDLVTHGELAVILNRVMRYPPAKWQYFNDTNGIWYEADANALMEQRVYGFIGRDSLGGRSISRESALSMIFDSFSVYLPDEQITKSFIDSDQIQASCKHAAKNMLNMGFISGFEDGSLRPKERLTRAQVVTILNNIIEVYITEPGIYDAPLGKRVCIVVPGVTLRGQDLDYLVVTPGAREGLTVIEDCIVRNGTFWNKFGGEEVSIIRYHLPDANITERIIVMADERFSGGLGVKEEPQLYCSQAQFESL